MAQVCANFFKNYIFYLLNNSGICSTHRKLASFPVQDSTESPVPRRSGESQLSSSATEAHGCSTAAKTYDPSTEAVTFIPCAVPAAESHDPSTATVTFHPCAVPAAESHDPSTATLSNDHKVSDGIFDPEPSTADQWHDPQITAETNDAIITVSTADSYDPSTAAQDQKYEPRTSAGTLNARTVQLILDSYEPSKAAEGHDFKTVAETQDTKTVPGVHDPGPLTGTSEQCKTVKTVNIGVGATVSVLGGRGQHLDNEPKYRSATVGSQIVSAVTQHTHTVGTQTSEVHAQTSGFDERTGLKRKCAIEADQRFGPNSCIDEILNIFHFRIKISKYPSIGSSSSGSQDLISNSQGSSFSRDDSLKSDILKIKTDICKSHISSFERFCEEQGISYPPLLKIPINTPVSILSVNIYTEDATFSGSCWCIRRCNKCIIGSFPRPAGIHFTST